MRRGALNEEDDRAAEEQPGGYPDQWRDRRRSADLDAADNRRHDRRLKGRHSRRSHEGKRNKEREQNGNKGTQGTDFSFSTSRKTSSVGGMVSSGLKAFA